MGLPTETHLRKMDALIANIDWSPGGWRFYNGFYICSRKWYVDVSSTEKIRFEDDHGSIC